MRTNSSPARKSLLLRRSNFMQKLHSARDLPHGNAGADDAPRARTIAAAPPNPAHGPRPRRYAILRRFIGTARKTLSVPAFARKEETDMGQPVVHWEMWSGDPEKVSAFYAQVFGWQIRRLPEMDYRFVETGGSGGVNGGIVAPKKGP